MLRRWSFTTDICNGSEAKRDSRTPRARSARLRWIATFGFPPLHTSPPNYCQDYPKKEYMQIPLSAEFSTFESFGVFSYNKAAKEVDDDEKTDACDRIGADVRFMRLL